MGHCPLKYKECPLKRPLSGRVVRSFEIQVAKTTNGQKNGSAEESRRNSYNSNKYSHKKTKDQNKMYNGTYISFEAIVLKLIFRYYNILAAGCIK